ncbi:hypothetical protein OJ997_16985 [Solirubrobacter phytolaccae]|uniref:PKD domain-containing protein n=1 Tax=Solirubrobacter phytolaccae TaxID=1404360 RepID=A0A9X3NC27_9ACTN|nr:hypothetical protein [Solirubrobacter phytolaccae]MDA0182002.1 hypothetical protein [Solirubrobacter phytolaccae]
MPRRLIVLLLMLLVFPATARADWFPAAAIDGPNADVVAVGNVDVARDGTGAVAYLRKDGGFTHAFVSRIVGGGWRAPERVDPATGEATEVKVAVGEGNRIVVAWVADGIVYANVAQGGTPEPGGFVGHTQLSGPNAKSVDIDLGINGAAYVTWEQDGNVIAARLQDTTWSWVPTPLDGDPNAVAGTGVLRPKVAVSAEGYAVITWGEVGPAGTRVWARRVTGLTLSAVPQILNLPEGGNADSPEIDIEEDGSFAWVVFRQDIAGGSRTIGRRLVGSLFEAPETFDGGLSSDEPRVDINGDGVGFGVAQGNGGALALGAWLFRDHFQPSMGLASGPSATPTRPDVSASDRGDVAVAWRTGELGGTIARARYKDEASTAVGPEFTVSNPALGPVVDPGVSISGDRVGDFAVAMVQGTPGAYTLTGAVFDRAPGAPFIEETTTYKRKTRPDLRWRAGIELWGAQRFRVYVDNVVIGETTSETLTPRVPLTTGKHTWQVEAVDVRGQTSRSRVRTLRIDALAPTLSVKVTGKRAAGQNLKVTVRATDTGGAGLDHITVDYGDKSAKSDKATTRHKYKRGTFRLKVAAVDKAGNVTRKEVRLRIKKK